MNAFYEANKDFILSVIFLTACLMAAGYSMLYKEREYTVANTTNMVAEMQVENSQLRKRVQKVQATRAEAAADEEDTSIRSMPVFLNRINSIAKDNDVVIEKLTPVEDQLNKFALTFKANYETFLGFAGAFESLNVEINDLEVRPYDPSVVPPVHVINFSLTPRNDAEELTGDRLRRLQADISKKGKRNPFQRFAEGTLQNVPLIDLTWVNKLTGIGSRNGKAYATIDRLDFSIGDTFGAKVITAIESDRVLLSEETDTGSRDYVLKFRKKLQ